MYMNGNYYYSFLNISFFSAIGRLLPIDASRIIVISFLIIINRFREGSLARLSRTKIIIILLFGSPGRPRRAPMKRPGRAGDGRAEHAFASASTNAMHEFVHDPHGLRCAVQARCNSCLVSRGDAPVAPAGQMPRPRPCAPSTPTGRSAARPAFFSGFPNHQIPAIKIFQSRKQVRIRSFLPRARRQIRKGEAIRLSWCSATAPC